MNTQWQNLGINAIRELLKVPIVGLSDSDAKQILLSVGPNTLKERPGISFSRILLRQFESPMILILLTAAIIAGISGNSEDTIFITIVLALNTTLGASQEFRAERGARSLRNLISVNATVKRDNRIVSINAIDLVPGDTIFLESGNFVPADIRLETSNALKVDESILTGESMAVEKQSSWIATSQVDLADIRNMVFAGTVVNHGRATGIVVETGTRTQLGIIATQVESEDAGTPPLVKRMQKFSQIIAIGVVLVASSLALFELIVHQSSPADAFEFAVALAISAIPEGLPIALTITLAVASIRMSRRHAIVRRLAAVEGLGSCTMIATDKTGTLTCNELTIKKLHLPNNSDYDVGGVGYNSNGDILDDKSLITRPTEEIVRLATAGFLCNEAHFDQKPDETYKFHGDAVDLAFIFLGLKCGLNKHKLISETSLLHQIPFEPELQFAATWHGIPGKPEIRISAKGAPERIIEMCSLQESERSREINAAMNLASQGYRVIALAGKSISRHKNHNMISGTPSGLNYLGCVAMIDPPRHGVQESIRQCKNAGISVIMVTGDHIMTAIAIAKSLGLVNPNNNGNGAVYSGHDIENALPEQLQDYLATGRVFARVNPSQKLRLVRTAQQMGHFVAVTGDGANDAPAMRASNIAVAMGRSGTDVARESADLVLSDDNFATIVAGIEEGRIAYDNIRKVIVLLVSTGLGEIMMVLTALLTGYPLPLLPLQLLWLNVATEAIQDEALAFEPNEGDVMQRKPRPTEEPIFNRILIERIVIGSLVMGAVGFSLFAIWIQTGHSLQESRNALLLLMVLFENVHLANCRSELKSVFKLSPLRSPALIFGVVLALSFHILAMHTTWFQRVLKVQPVSWKSWILLIMLALSILPVIEIHKWICRRRLRRDSL